MAASDSLQEELLGSSRTKEEGEGVADSVSFQQLKASLSSIADVWRARARGHPSARAGEADTRAPWRRKLGELLESTPFHAFILALLLLDLLATVVDVLHTLHNDSHDLSECISMLESCQCTSRFEQSESWEFLYYIGLAVLCVLALNLLGLLLAFGLAFFRHAGYVLDLVVVVTALCLEIFLDTETAGLLVILNLWRIVRVAHGIFEVTDEAWEKEMQKLEEQLKAVESAHENDVQMLREKGQRIAELEMQLAAASKASELPAQRRHSQQDEDEERRPNQAEDDHDSGNPGYS